jgi:hypothetical protein
MRVPVPVPLPVLPVTVVVVVRVGGVVTQEASVMRSA